MKKKKIMHILQSDRFSGAENVVCQIIDIFNDEFDMIYSSRDGQIRETLAERNIKFLPLKEINKKEIEKAIEEVKPDIIHAHDRSASYYSSLATKNIPIVVHMHVNNNNGIKTYIKNMLWTRKSTRFSHIFWVSKSSFDGFQFNSKLKSKSSILYNVLDKESINNRMNLDINTYSYDIVYCGRLTEQKNPKRLIEVLKIICEEVENVKVAICGTGEYETYVKDFVVEHNLNNNIDCLGYVMNPLKILKTSKVMLMTSNFEGTPMVAIEAQILGLPVVSTPVDGMLDVIVNGQNGYLKDTNTELANSCIKLVKEENMQKKFSQNSKKMINKFTDINKYKNELLDVYNGSL
ncbi:glycosyltransferase [Peptostreptococcus equinus]|uniref:Glycosyltransferase n=1 Tax=Peptostreptococcus equinus TaxID=3003601 RepID=A0ABY7JLC6_9FIRM|nr:glycosyltransferase [Peptostreptococcus sp. CBA3647]WAW14156.1 glycosyltransferase [Peptostreptococcus sp. CBA3647]